MAKMHISHINMYFIKSFLKRKRRIRKAKARGTKITRVGVGNLYNREIYELASSCPKCNSDVHIYDESLKLN